LWTDLFDAMKKKTSRPRVELRAATIRNELTKSVFN